MTTVCLSFDFDAISLWIGPMGATSPSMISRGEFGAVGARRILDLLDHHGIPATFFVTGHTADTYPGITRDIAAAGHEIGHHGYLHENPIALPGRDAELDVLRRGFAALERAAGVRPVGYRSPSWDTSPYTIDLLIEEGFEYDSSLMGSDFTPYWCRVGDVIQPDGPYLFGSPTSLVELPVSWILDDFPHFEYLRVENRVYPGLSAASKVEEIWMDEFSYCHDEVKDGVFTLTMHPQVIGRGHRMMMLDRLVTTIREETDVEFSTMAGAAQAWRNRQGSGNVN